MNHELPIRVAALKVISEHTAKLYKETREELGAQMTKGSTVAAWSPIADTKIGSISLSNPKATARIADEAAFGAWAALHYPDRVVYELEVVGSHEEVSAVLFDHAEHLVKRVTRVDPDLIKEVRAVSAAVKQPAGPDGELDVPGVVVETPEPVVSCRPSDGALAEVIELFRAERLSLESLTFPQLPGGAA